MPFLGSHCVKHVRCKSSPVQSLPLANRRLSFGTSAARRRCSMTLMLHVNASDVPYDGLRQLETPPATQSHVPIPHFRVVDLVKSTVGMFGHEVVAEHHGVTEDGARYFG